MRGKSFSKHEDEVLLRCVAKHNNNLHKAFETAAKKTNRSVGSVVSRYYKVLRKDHPLLVVAPVRQSKKISENPKDPKNLNQCKQSVSLLSRFLDFFKFNN